MPSRSFVRLTALFGALFAVLTLVGFAVVSAASDLSTIILPTHDEAARMAATATPGAVWVGRGIQVAGIGMFGAFATALVVLLRQDGRPRTRWLASLASLGIAVHVVLILLSLAIWSTIDERAAHGLDAQGAIVLADLKSVTFFLSWTALGVFLVATGALVRRSAILPAWLGWSALGIGVLEIGAATAPTAGASQMTQMLSYLWAIAVAVVMAFGRHRALSPTHEAAMMRA